MGCTCKVGPGRFEGEGALTFMAQESAAMGLADESIGRYDFFRTPFNFDADEEIVKNALHYGYCKECVEDASGHGDGYGLVTWTDSQGFAYLETFDMQAEYDRAVAEASEEEADDE